MYYLVISLICVFTLSALIKKDRINKKSIAFFDLIVTIVYLIWRFTVIPTVNIFSFIIGISLLIAELIVIAQFLISQFLLSEEYKVKKKTLDDFGGDIPTVDIFICTYNEPENIVETTTIATLNLDYPTEKYKVYICDDGNRNNIKLLANKYNVEYITRDTNKGAKAGNINNALLKTDSDLFVVLDADMICSKSFLKHTVGYFTDLEIAFVQTPQVYYNKDMYQHNLGKDIPNEQDFFMREIQEARAKSNAVLHVGTNAVFRRQSVIEIGMYPTTTITEDMAVGMLLQAAGYKSVFINEVLILGLTASTYTDLVIQRDRWCRGNLQTSKRFRPTRQKGLNLIQKIIYSSGTIYWYTFVSKMIFTICPLLFLLTTQRSMNANLQSLLIYFIPFFLTQFVSFYSVVSNTRSLKWAHYYDIAMAPHMCISIIKEYFSPKIDFSVTPKDIRNDKSYFQTQVIIPHLILAFITIFSWIVGSFYLYKGFISIIPFCINLIWSIYNFNGIVICVRVAYHIADIKHSEIAIVEQPALISIDGEYFGSLITGLSKNGMKVKLDGKPTSNKAQIILKGNDTVAIKGVLNITEAFGDFIYESMSLSQKKAIVKIYVEHLQPTFNVEKHANYI